LFYRVFSCFWNMQLFKTSIFSAVMPADRYLIRSLSTHMYMIFVEICVRKKWHIQEILFY
jgi:hypothetical protein